ncbi:MAG: FAD:protein FMN transferase [Pseudomonadota bacterium]
MIDARRQQPLLGTFVEIGVAMRPGNAAGAHAAIDAGFAAIAGVQRQLAFHDPASELSRLNREGHRGIVLSPLAARVLRLALAMGRASDDRFNCTVGGELVRRGALPDHRPHERRAEQALRGSWRDIGLQGRQVRLRQPLCITFDGIAKGYAVDLAVQALRRHGAVAGWTNAGGDLRAFGDFVLPVQLRHADGTPGSVHGLREAAIAASRVAAAPDPRHPGLIVAGDGDAPHAGQWTVLARRAWRADALTKVAALAAADERAALVARLGGILLAA